MSIERDPLTGAEVVIIESRQKRPNLPPSGCPFCPGGLEAPDDYDVRWFENRFPAFPNDRCEIVLYTSDHAGDFESIGVDGARKVVDLWAERTQTLGSRDEISYVLVFENRGSAVGATIDHPHGQIYAFDHVPPIPTAELRHDACVLCEYRPPAENIVAEHGAWKAWTPPASAFPYEMLLAPSPHIGRLGESDAGDGDLAELLVDVLPRLDALFNAPMPYMMWIHQEPTDGGDWPAAHLHIHVCPVYRSEATMRFVAAGEVGSGTYFNPVSPVAAAAALRAPS